MYKMSKSDYSLQHLVDEINFYSNSCFYSLHIVAKVISYGAISSAIRRMNELDVESRSH